MAPAGGSKMQVPTAKQFMTLNQRAAMRDLIPSSDRARNTWSLAAKALPVCGLLLLTACATARTPADQTRGYSETQLGRNIFTVRARETTHLSSSNSKATELGLLRCAEVTLAYGFRHFVVLESAN